MIFIILLQIKHTLHNNYISFIEIEFNSNTARNILTYLRQLFVRHKIHVFTFRTGKARKINLALSSKLN